MLFSDERFDFMNFQQLPFSSLTRMTDDEVKELFPTVTDAKKLSELMRIVKSAEARNTKISNIVDNSEKFAGIVLTLLDKFV
jgi:hypothetical protein